MIHFVCKYTPLEIFAGFGVSCVSFDKAYESTPAADEALSGNVCGFARALMEAALTGQIHELVLVNCCDTMRRVYEILRSKQVCSFLYLMDLPRCVSSCAKTRLATELRRLRDAYAHYSGRTFNMQACRNALAMQACGGLNAHEDEQAHGDLGTQVATQDKTAFVALLGTRTSAQLTQSIEAALVLPVQDRTCTGLRNVQLDADLCLPCEEAFFEAYAHALLAQIPCARMGQPAARRQLACDPRVRGIIYHTVRFCDFYGAEATAMARTAQVPALQLESDFTLQAAGQMRTRIEAFAEELGVHEASNTQEGTAMPMPSDAVVAGVDIGSASADVVLMDAQKHILASGVVSTTGSAAQSAEHCLAKVLDEAGMSRDQLYRIVSTGYGRDAVDENASTITEISCHAKGAHYLDPSVRTVVDIGGQDSKCIGVDEQGGVCDFTMNDKCAAGTGRFLETMARTLGVPLAEMGTLGLQSTRKLTISNTCTVFAESEVVTLMASDVETADIIAALHRSVARRTASLTRRVGINERVMMTGGVAKNAGVVHALEEALGCSVCVDERSQLCGAIGAALFAFE